MVVGVGVVLGCREMERGLPWPTIARSSSFWARVASILGHLLKAAVYVLPALTVRHKATSVHRNPGSAFPENKHHIWWECLLKKIVKKKNTKPTPKPGWVDPVNKGGGKAVCCLGRTLGL